MDKPYNCCDNCIKYLRELMFKNKISVPYNKIKQMLEKETITSIKNEKINKIYMSNIYTKCSVTKNYNIEHIVPASAMYKRSGERTNFENSVYYNNEQYSDINNLFIIPDDLNTYRGNIPFGEVLNNAETKMSYDPKCGEETGTVMFEKKPNKDEIIISDPEDKKKKPTTVCKQNAEKCTFKPYDFTKKYIAKVLFYFHLMYGYDPNSRPGSTKDDLQHYVWLGKVSDDGKAFNAFNSDNGWTEFFFNNIKLFKEWNSMRNDPRNFIYITKMNEYNKQNAIKFGIPNIFIGYYENDNKYVFTDDKLVDELFFKPDDHDCKKIQNRQYIYTDKSLNIQNKLTGMNPAIKKIAEKIKFLDEYKDTDIEKVLNDKVKGKIFRDKIEIYNAKIDGDIKKFEKYIDITQMKHELNLYIVYKKDLENIQIPDEVIQNMHTTSKVDKLTVDKMIELLSKDQSRLDANIKKQYYSQILDAKRFIEDEIKKYEDYISELNLIIKNINNYLKSEYNKIYIKTNTKTNIEHKYLKYKYKYAKIKQMLAQQVTTL